MFLNNPDIGNPVRKIWIVIGGIALFMFLAFIFIFLLFISLLFSSSDIEVSGSGDVALIPIKGELVTDPGFSIGGSESTSEDIIKLVEKANKDPFVKGIILEINSPGGSAVASEEIANAIKKVKKPKAAWIREAGASGAYWVASSTDHIVASKMSIVGSIGVTASYLRIGGILNKYNITYERMVAGKYKDEGTPFRDMTPEERAMLQQDLDAIHREFIKAVAENRKTSYSEIEKLATGEVFLGEEALNAGLIDSIGSKQEALEYINKRINGTGTIVEYRKKTSFFDSFSSTLNQQSFNVGRGIGSSLLSDERIGVRT